MSRRFYFLLFNSTIRFYKNPFCSNVKTMLRPSNVPSMIRLALTLSPIFSTRTFSVFISFGYFFVNFALRSHTKTYESMIEWKFVNFAFRTLNNEAVFFYFLESCACKLVYIVFSIMHFVSFFVTGSRSRPIAGIISTMDTSAPLGAKNSTTSRPTAPPPITTTF